MMQPEEHCLQIFPIEVWESVLNCLDHEDLLACRLVCRDWMHLVDDVFERRIWSPYFAKNRVADILSMFLVKCKGTRFSNAEEVDAFIERHERSEEPFQNPFYNHTVIMSCRSIQQYAKLSEKFPILVHLYGQHVRHCLYFVHNEVPESLHNFPLIYQLKNLHTLTVYCADWDKRGIKSILESWQHDPFPAPRLKHFKNLSILGDRGYTVFKPLFSNYSGQIRRLNCWGHNLMEDASREFARDVSEAVTSLEEFKVCDVSTTLIACVCGRVKWPLKRLSIKISYSDDTINLGHFMEHLKKYAGTLEAFHLQVDERQIHNNIYLYNVCFPNVTDLRLPFYVNRGVPFFLFDLMKKFPKVKHLQLVDSEEPRQEPVGEARLLYHRRRPTVALDEMVEALWARLPPGVQMLSMRYRKFGQNLRGANSGSVVYKYRQSRVAAEASGAAPVVYNNNK